MPAYKIIGGDKKEYGPATAEEIRQWIADGRLNGQSLILVEGRTQWEPLENLGEFFAALHAQARTEAELRPPPQPLSAATPASFTAPAHPEVRIASCFSRSLALIGQHAPLILVSAFIVGITGFVLQFLPVVGMIYLVIKGALYGGLSIVYLKAIRGEAASPADTFCGFHRNFAQLMLTGMITSILTEIALIFLIPGIYLGVCWTFAIMLTADRGMEFWPAMELSRKTVNRVWFKMFALLLIAFLPYVLMTLYTEVEIFRRSWPLLQEVLSGAGSRDTGVLVQKLITGITEVVKVLTPLVVGSKVVLLFLLPFAYGVVMFAYEDLFGPRKPGSD